MSCKKIESGRKLCFAILKHLLSTSKTPAVWIQRLKKSHGRCIPERKSNGGNRYKQIIIEKRECYNKYLEQSTVRRESGIQLS